MTQPRILFTGTTGLLGRYFLKQKVSGDEVIGISTKDIDITDKKKIFGFVKKIHPRIIVHAASIGNVDYCEKHPKEAFKVNVEGTQNIIEAAKQVKAKIIFLSSNAIYDGVGAPYDENATANPIDVYGKTKVEGENLIKKSNLNFCIIRLITIYGWPQRGGRSNPVVWVIESLKKGEKINVVNDVFNNHLWAGQAAEVIWSIIKRNMEGIFNIAGQDYINRYELALRVADIFKLDKSLIIPMTTDKLNQTAKRPLRAGLHINKVLGEINYTSKNTKEALLDMKLRKL